MVPLTWFSFWVGSLCYSGLSYATPDPLDIVALVISAAGVFMYNWFEEKPQKASIENL